MRRFVSFLVAPLMSLLAAYITFGPSDRVFFGAASYEEVIAVIGYSALGTWIASTVLLLLDRAICHPRE